MRDRVAAASLPITSAGEPDGHLVYRVVVTASWAATARTAHSPDNRAHAIANTHLLQYAAVTEYGRTGRGGFRFR